MDSIDLPHKPNQTIKRIGSIKVQLGNVKKLKTALSRR